MEWRREGVVWALGFSSPWGCVRKELKVQRVYQRSLNQTRKESVLSDSPICCCAIGVVIRVVS